VVLALYGEGVDAIGTSADWPDDHWHRRACGDWSAVDLAGHLVCVIAWYHEWLDAAARGECRPPFDEAHLADQNAAALLQLELGSGPERIEHFVSEAKRYAARLPEARDLRYGYPYGTVTAGLHAGVAACEWHLHAWDLTDGKHRPSDPAALFVAVGSAMTAAKGGLAARAGRVLVPFASHRRPWDQLLKRSGRS